MSQIDRLTARVAFTMTGDGPSDYFQGLWKRTAVRIEAAEGSVGAVGAQMAAIAALAPLVPGTATTAQIATAVNAIIAAAGA